MAIRTGTRVCLVGCLLSLALLVGLVACTSGRPEYPQATRVAPPPVPIYPGAQDVATREEWVAGASARITNFRTADPSAAVATFYRNRLPPQGWVEEPEKGGQGRLFFANRVACPLYSLYVSSRAAGTDPAEVELRLVESPCIGG